MVTNSLTSRVPDLAVFKKALEVMLLKDGKLTTTATLREGILRPTLFPEAAVDIASVWPE